MSNTQTRTVRAAAFEILYNQHQWTHVLTPYLESLSWTEKMGGESDDLNITLEDVDGLWLDRYYPNKGANLTVRMGYKGESLHLLPKFNIDEITLDGPPSAVHIKALSASVQDALRTRNHEAYENTTLDVIATQVAQRQGLQLIGEIEPLTLDRITQYGETDLAFLQRIAQLHGYAVKVQSTEKKLVFVRRGAMHASAAARQLSRADLSKYEFTDKLSDVPSAVTNSYHDPKTKQLISVTAKDGQTSITSDPSAGRTSSADIVYTHKRATTAQAAGTIARAELERRQLERTVARVDLPGDINLCCGMAVNLLDFGKLGGKYTITQARHEISRSSGYVTSLELKRIAPQTSSKKSGLATYGMQNGEVVVVDRAPAKKSDKK